MQEADVTTTDLTAAELGEAFDTYDSQKTGHLRPGELDCVLEALSFSAAEKQDVVFALDIDGDGTISREEFCTITSQTASETEFYRRLFGYLRSRRKKQDFNDPWPGKVGSLTTLEEFDQLVAAAGTTPVVGKIFAPWCRKCAALKPKFKHLALGYGDRVVFVEMSLENKALKSALLERGVNQIPTFQVWKEGAKVEEYVAGKSIVAVPKKLAHIIDRHLESFSLLDELSGASFSDIDADGSGVISRGEFSLFFQSRGWPQERIDKTFEAMDYDSDGGISQTEFQSFCEQTGASVATGPSPLS